MNKRQEDIARAAQKVNKGWTVDDFMEAVLESTRKTGFGMVHALNGFIEMQSYDLDQIYQDYADAIDKDELTTQEKRQALMNHVLERGA